MMYLFKVLFFALAFFTFVGCGSSSTVPHTTSHEENITKEDEQNISKEDEQNLTEVNCDQVITHAYNPTTLEERDFPTPCDVLDGWVVGTPPVVATVYGQMGKKTVVVSKYSKNEHAVVYHPRDWNENHTPVVFFGTGFRDTNHTRYSKLLEFVASHGYSVVYVADSGSYYAQLKIFDGIVTEFTDNLDISKIGVLGHSSGGGFAFKILEYMIAKDYGSDGRFLAVMDPYFAQYMDKSNMSTLDNTNVLFIQFGPSGNNTDPRIALVSYNLLTAENIDKNYIVLKEQNEHGYPRRQNIDNMQGLLMPLDALMKYTFIEESDNHHNIALKGIGKVNPYNDGYQKVLNIDTYKYSCKYIHNNKYHKGSDGKTVTTINNCGEPEIQSN